MNKNHVDVIREVLRKHLSLLSSGQRSNSARRDAGRNSEHESKTAAKPECGRTCVSVCAQMGGEAREQ